MPKVHTALGFDFGASSGRAILGGIEEGRLALREVYRFDNIPVEESGHVCWDLPGLWEHIQEGIRRAAAEGGFDSIGIDTWGVDFGMMDGKGKLMSLPVHYRDERTDGVMEQAFQRVPAQEIYRRTGIQFMRFNTLFQLYYLTQHEPQTLKQCRTILPMPDLFAYLLTGEMHAEETMASTTQMLNPYDKTWDTDLLRSLDIPTGILPPLVKSGSVCGTIRPGTVPGLALEGIPVIHVASHDTASAVLAVPSQEPAVYISCGTWSLMGTELDSPAISEEAFGYNFTNEGGYGGTTRLLKNIMGLWLIQESRRQYAREGQSYSYADLERLALQAKPLQSFIDPDDARFDRMGDIPSRIRAYCAETGQHVPQDTGEVMRCIYESLALKYRYVFGQLQALAGRSYPCIHIIGGGTKDGLLCRFTADCCGVEVCAGPIEATAIGNLCAQLIACGQLEGVGQARALIRDSFALKRFAPQGSGQWDNAYTRFAALLERKV